MLAHQKKKDTVYCRLTGELDHHTAQSIREELDLLIFNPKITRLVLDLEGLSFMDSSGIGVVIGRYRQLKVRNGSLAIRRPSEHVDKIFKMAGLYQIIEKIS